MKAIVTVGLGFGDEGKGATVDFLTRQYNADLVVRYSGGAQAGHNVQLTDGRRHTFSQFGAGTLAGAKTFLGARVIVNPATLVPEADHLERLGVRNVRSRLTLHPSCLISSVYHVTMNRLRETARGAGRHGSCGLGVGETRQYWLSHGSDAIRATDLRDRETMIDKLTLLRDRMLLEMQSLDRIDPELANQLHGCPPHLEADLLADAMSGVNVSAVMPSASHAIFEGSQGVLLDEYFGFHPHTTWSTVTTKHALEMIDDAGIDDVETLGITRAYSTRHGAGPFPTRCQVMTNELQDLGNPHNDWQGSIQAGALDMMLLRYACDVNAVDGLVVNSLDELPIKPNICRRYSDVRRLDVPRCMADQERLTEHLLRAVPLIEPTSRDELLSELAAIAPIKILSHGPSSNDREWADKWATADRAATSA